MKYAKVGAFSECAIPQPGAFRELVSYCAELSFILGSAIGVILCALYFLIVGVILPYFLLFVLLGHSFV